MSLPCWHEFCEMHQSRLPDRIFYSGKGTTHDPLDVGSRIGVCIAVGECDDCVGSRLWRHRLRTRLRAVRRHRLLRRLRFGPRDWRLRRRPSHRRLQRLWRLRPWLRFQLWRSPAALRSPTGTTTLPPSSGTGTISTSRQGTTTCTSPATATIIITTSAPSRDQTWSRSPRGVIRNGVVPALRHARSRYESRARSTSRSKAAEMLSRGEYGPGV